MTLAVTEVLNTNKPNLDMTLAVTEVLNTNLSEQQGEKWKVNINFSDWCF